MKVVENNVHYEIIDDVCVCVCVCVCGGDARVYNRLEVIFKTHPYIRKCICIIWPYGERERVCVCGGGGYYSNCLFDYNIIFPYKTS